MVRYCRAEWDLVGGCPRGQSCLLAKVRISNHSNTQGKSKQAYSRSDEEEEKEESAYLILIFASQQRSNP